MSDKQVKEIMLNLYPKKKMIPVEEEDENPTPYYELQQKMLDESSKGFFSDNKEIDKWIFSSILAGISVFLFSSFFLDFVDDVCMKKDISAFNSKGEPKMRLSLTIFIILVLITRVVFSLI